MTARPHKLEGAVQIRRNRLPAETITSCCEMSCRLDETCGHLSTWYIYHSITTSQSLYQACCPRTQLGDPGAWQFNMVFYPKIGPSFGAKASERCYLKIIHIHVSTSGMDWKSAQPAHPCRELEWHPKFRHNKGPKMTWKTGLKSGQSPLPPGIREM